jgi:hypothetical protein
MITLLKELLREKQRLTITIQWVRLFKEARKEHHLYGQTAGEEMSWEEQDERNMDIEKTIPKISELYTVLPLINKGIKFMSEGIFVPL